jgi:sulfite reductase alpha subunit-like flavoprotein
VTSEDHFQDTRSVEFDISTEISFEPGDVCMIQPQNLEDNVERFVQLFSHFDVDAEFDISTRDSDAK